MLETRVHKKAGWTREGDECVIALPGPLPQLRMPMELLYEQHLEVERNLITPWLAERAERAANAKSSEG